MSAGGDALGDVGITGFQRRGAAQRELAVSTAKWPATPAPSSGGSVRRTAHSMAQTQNEIVSSAMHASQSPTTGLGTEMVRDGGLLHQFSAGDSFRNATARHVPGRSRPTCRPLQPRLRWRILREWRTLPAARS